MTTLVRLEPRTAGPRRRRSIAILGAPNSGKTTLFNALTGHRAKAGNYPGVTVDRREGELHARFGADAVHLIDLPGIYSLTPQSEDEDVAARVLRGELGEYPPDGIVVVVDATTVDRGLPLLLEAAALDLPVCLVLTMVDELKARHGALDANALRLELGVPVVGVVGNRGIGIDDLGVLLARPESWAAASPLVDAGELETPEERFEWSHALLDRCRRQRPEPSGWTRRLDRLLLHPFLGPAVFLTFVALFFQAIFTWTAPAMDLLSGLMDGLADELAVGLPDVLAARLLTDGVIRGVGSVIVFLPQIILLFTVILFLEGCGYMARAAFVVDRAMGWVGLEGRCFLALLSSYACAVPGIMATRTIPSPRDRLTTILVAPFATCSARLPVYTLLIAAFIPAEPLWGPFTWQGLSLAGLYFLGAAAALVSAMVLKRGLLRGALLPFYLELPPFRLPRPSDIALGVWDRVRLFLRRAGTIILAASIVLWFLLNLPQREPDPELGFAANQQAVLEGSYAASVGRLLEPVFAPMDFDWKINVGLLASQAAREVMVATLAQVYAHQTDDTIGLGGVLAGAGAGGGPPPLSRASALALLVYFAFAMQCVSTLVVMRRETGRWRWPAFAFVYMTGLGWLGAWLTFQVASAVGG